MSITVTVNGLTITGASEDIRQLLGMSPSAPSAKRGPGRPPKTAVGWPIDAKDGVQAEKPRKPASPEVQKARKLQGAWMGISRQLKGAQKAAVLKLREEKGVEAAITEARKLVEGSRKKSGK